MPPTLTYPGVYIQEVPSGVRPIAGVSTGTALFIGASGRGRLDDPRGVSEVGSSRRPLIFVDQSTEDVTATQLTKGRRPRCVTTP
jgi:uncharacterized protein